MSLDLNPLVKTIYNTYWENRFRLRVGSIDMEDMTARIRRQTKGGISDGNNKGTRLEDQRTQKYSLGGDHLLGELKLDWKVSYSEASEDRMRNWNEQKNFQKYIQILKDWW